ncbi:MAG: cytochrome d ubiquinol oxidase subunit II [Bryobacteraceae bacterium]
METFWFWAVASMIAAYVVLDGFDLGAGIVHLWVARTSEERRLVLRTIGPVWDGNEVWLIAAGGVLYFAFPPLYASSFSGFYLPLMIVLWLLILRGIAIEFRNHIDDAVWTPLWDVVFAGASALLTLFFGAALGNVVRGVPLDASGYFFLPLWTDFGLDGEVGILDWYTVTVGVTALAALAVHGAHWVALKTEGTLQSRCRLLANRAWPLLVALTVAITIVSFRVQPQLPKRFAEAPASWILPLATIAGLAAMRFRAGDFDRFLASCTYLAGLLTSAAAGIFPYVLPSNRDLAQGLTIRNASAPPEGLMTGLLWWTPGMILVIGYFVFTYRNFAGKVSAASEGH